MPANRQSPKIEFGQDPYVTGAASWNALEVAIGREICAFGKQQNITVAELAAETHLSIGMLLKIENDDTSMSAPTLQTISHALSVPLTAFFRQYEEHRMAVHTIA